MTLRLLTSAGLGNTVPAEQAGLPDGSQAPYEKPRALRKEELPGIIDEYVGRQKRPGSRL